MNRSALALLLIGGSLLGGCSSAFQLSGTTIASAKLFDDSGAPVGTAMITRTRDLLTFSVAAVGLPSGQHGLHLHTIGRCDAPGFTSAGGHLNPGARQHGKNNPAGSHLGDFSNITIDDNGTGAVSLELAGPADNAMAAIFDTDGSAIVVHAAADDYRTDPTGNSGARIACGVLVRS